MLLFVAVTEPARCKVPVRLALWAGLMYCCLDSEVQSGQKSSEELSLSNLVVYMRTENL